MFVPLRQRRFPEIVKDSITSRDTLIEQVQRIMDFMVKHTNKAYIITGNPKREERWDYPMDALLDGLTIEQIKTGNYKSHLRNKQIATIFRELDLIEKYGSGVRRVIDTFTAYGLPVPEFEATQGGMAVTVFKAPAPTNAGGVNEGVSEGVNALLELIGKQPDMRSPAMAAALGTSAKNIERWVKQLKSRGLIEFRGAPKTGGYHRMDI
jgi:ATP-dependent DNA helicase RecG